MRAFSVNVRSPLALVIRPNWLEPMFEPGLPQIGVLRMLIASIRSVNSVPSLI